MKLIHLLESEFDNQPVGSINAQIDILNNKLTSLDKDFEYYHQREIKLKTNIKNNLSVRKIPIIWISTSERELNNCMHDPAIDEFNNEYAKLLTKLTQLVVKKTAIKHKIALLQGSNYSSKYIV